MSESFDAGFVDGTNVVRIKTRDDLKETWGTLLNGSKVMLWCDGLVAEPKRQPGLRGIGDADDGPFEKKKACEHKEKYRRSLISSKEPI